MADETACQPLRDRLREALTAAMKAQNAVAVRVLRSTLGVIDNAEAVPVSFRPSQGSAPFGGAVAGLGAAEAPRRELSESDVVSIVRAEVAERQSAAEEYERLGRHDRAERLAAETAILIAHLDGS